MPKETEDGYASTSAQRVLEVGARIECGPSELLIGTAFRKELEEQEGLFEAMGLADLAHTLVMMDAGIIPARAGCELLGSLLRLQERPSDFIPDPSYGDMYSISRFYVAQYLID